MVKVRSEASVCGMKSPIPWIKRTDALISPHQSIACRGHFPHGVLGRVCHGGEMAHFACPARRGLAVEMEFDVLGCESAGPVGLDLRRIFPAGEPDVAEQVRHRRGPE